MQQYFNTLPSLDDYLQSFKSTHKPYSHKYSKLNANNSIIEQPSMIKEFKETIQVNQSSQTQMKLLIDASIQTNKKQTNDKEIQVQQFKQFSDKQSQTSQQKKSAQIQVEMKKDEKQKDQENDNENKNEIHSRRISRRISKVKQITHPLEIQIADDEQDNENIKFIMELLERQDQKTYQEMQDMTQFEEVYQLLAFVSQQLEGGAFQFDEMIKRIQLIMQLYLEVITKLQKAFLIEQKQKIRFQIPDEKQFKTVEDKLRNNQFEPSPTLKKSQSIDMDKYSLKIDEITSDVFNKNFEVFPKQRMSQSVKFQNIKKSITSDEELPNLLDDPSEPQTFTDTNSSDEAG